MRGSNCPTHSFVSTDGKPHAVKCMDLKGIFRIIQSIPSKKAEPFKRWLAQVGAERIHQMQDPELGRSASDIDYQEPFYNFWLWLDCADEVVYYTIKGSGLRMDNVEEWMHQFFEKLVKANPKYCSDSVIEMG